MPKRLLERCNPDSIREFRAAAARRFAEGLTLAVNGQRTGAIYLWGYAAEMTIKAAYFSLVGLANSDPITWAGHLKPAMAIGASLNIIWPSQGAGHNVRAWAELLIVVRSQSSATAFAAPFAREVQRQGQRIELLWRESLRYHKNVAYLHEVKQVREAAEWFLSHSDAL